MIFHVKRRVSILICFFVFNFRAFANPEGGVVARGDALITTQGDVLNIAQTSDKAIIDWRSFDIKQGETTHFQLPSSNSVTLSRVNSEYGSIIAGNLTANGNLFLINQNGILFTNTAQINVNSLIATTSDIDNDKFMNGKFEFNIPGKPDSIIINAGEITAKDAGLVGFVAPNIINSGYIVANGGKVQLSTGDKFKIDLYGDKLMEIEVSNDLKKQLLENKGIIEAPGGKIILTASAGRAIIDSLINAEGILSAPSVSEKNGEIYIYGEGAKVLVAGVLNASGRKSGERGGKITVTGKNVALLDGTLIDASGDTGFTGTTLNKEISARREGSSGGEILIGGDYLGGGTTPRAENLYVDEGVLVLNDSLTIGDAGRTIFWSDDTTNFYGNVYARSLGGKSADLNSYDATNGGNIGDGGFVETSGKNHLDVGGYANLTASSGERGTYTISRI